jgi:Flp pilus assembly protein TadG
MSPRSLRRRLVAANGQAMIETALIMPLVMILVLGVIEYSYALLDAHVVTKATREGSNLISRNVSLQDAVTAMRNMSDRPLNFDDGSSTVIFSVLKRGATSGTTNYDINILYQRVTYGTLAAASKLNTRGSGSFGGAPDYQAVNSDSDANLQVTNVPAGLLVTKGGMIYVTEIYTRHTLLTPLGNFGLPLPQTLYSIAYF